ncbi:magnesium transporter CorA family protein [Actinokineospora sp. HUAS TT18]|uniref:magnesium transporter CorA family protein n=1 Tax=Actinokineospora sp. HUAS TT18 TaxID=3447451 RepID=UPI003F527AB3
MARTRLYRDGVLQAEDFPAAEIPGHLTDPAAMVWLDLSGPTADELAAVGEEFGLHHLAVEDAGTTHARPKLHRYDTHEFLTAYAVHFDQRTGGIAKAELAAFVTPRALITIRKSDRFDIDTVIARWDAAADLAKEGVGYLVHGLLDYAVDTQLDAISLLDEEIEALEDTVFSDTADDRGVHRRSLRLRKTLVALRRVVLPMREVANSLMRRDANLVRGALVPYYQDLYDNVLRATEWTESQREVVATIRETQLNVQGNRLNTIMKKVTSWAAIIAVPTAITGFYGQNVPYPGYAQPIGFWVSTVAIVVLSFGLYALFKRRDWL